MNNMEKLILLKSVLETGCTDWSYDPVEEEIIAAYPEVDGLIYSRYWIDEDEDGQKCVYFQDKWDEGYIKTDIGVLCQV